MGRVQHRLMGLLAACACGLLGACGHSAGDSVGPRVKRQAAGVAGSMAGVVQPTGNGTDLGPNDLVSAVSGGGAGSGSDGPVGLKFQVRQRPVVGKAVGITLRLAANEPLEHLEARFQSDAGLDITQGGEFAPRGHMDPGATVDHALTVVPVHEGVFTVMATVTTGSAAQTVSRSFVIPVVVGSPR